MYVFHKHLLRFLIALRFEGLWWTTTVNKKASTDCVCTPSLNVKLRYILTRNNRQKTYRPPFQPTPYIWQNITITSPELGTLMIAELC